MRFVELQKVLRAADPAAVLVPPRIMERVIQQAYDLRGLVWSVPHRKCFVVDRQTLFRHAEQSDLDLEPDQLLPDTVILLARPPAEELSALEHKLVLLKYWRRLFHASVHVVLERGGPGHPGVAGSARVTPVGPARLGPLTPEQVAERVREIGPSEFEEIREILVQDRYLLSGAGDRATYVEFAAVYLETRYFAPSTLPGLFPGFRDTGRIDRLLARDVDAAGLFERTRLAEAADPVATIETRSEESHEQYWALVRSAERADLAGNTVRAAILRTRAWRIAPASLSQGTRDQAEAGMRRLAERLAAALRLGQAEAGEWAGDLLLFLDKADQGNRPAEARLLEELQKVCLDAERDIYTLDLVEWVLSAGKRPVKRPLPSMRLVRTARHLHKASQRLGAVRLPEADRLHLARMVHAARSRIEDEVRSRFGPVLTSALQDVGLGPTNPPERVAFAKMVEELLDRVISQGFLTFGDLRDAISRNQLKMPDLRDAEDFVRGDPLLRLDRRLASLLDGVYRPSELYMRWLERLTALNFGTGVGRAITLWVTLPFGGAALLLQVLGVLFHLTVNFNRHPLVHTFYLVLTGSWGHAQASAAPVPTTAPAHPSPPLAWHYLLLGALGLFLMALIHSEPLRHRCRHVAAAVGRVLRTALIDLPMALFRLPVLRRLAGSWPFQLFWWYVLKPAAAAALAWLFLPPAWRTPGMAAALFLASALVLNSRMGRAATEAVALAFASFAGVVRAGLLPGLYRMIVRAFKKVIDAVEWVLFTVDDWLRFREGDSRASLVVRTALGVLWFPVSYLARFYTVVLIEPGFNPIKAPVSYLAAKVMLPLSVTLTGFLVSRLAPFLSEWLAYALVLPTVWLLPDAFGFLFWETKENWSLYRANRRRLLHAVAVGPHGETIKALLHPGFHSGTVPRLYRRLRHEEREAYQTRNWGGGGACRHELDEIGGVVARFVSRELVAILRQSAGWQGERLIVGHVRLAVNRIGIELSHADWPERPVEIEFELRHGWLVAGLCESGWLDQLAPSPLRAFTTALVNLYKLAGVELVREQVQSNLPIPFAEWEVTPEGLSVRPRRQSAQDAMASPLVYDLRDPAAEGRPLQSVDGLDSAVAAGVKSESDRPDGDGAPTIDPQRLVFAWSPVYWQEWQESWEKERAGHDHPGLGKWDRELLPPELLPVPAQPAAPPPPAQTTPATEIAGALPSIAH